MFPPGSETGSAEMYCFKIHNTNAINVIRQRGLPIGDVFPDNEAASAEMYCSPLSATNRHSLLDALFHIFSLF